MDRVFYSSNNLNNLKNYSLIGALPTSLYPKRDPGGSKDLENSRNYIQYRTARSYSAGRRGLAKRDTLSTSLPLRSKKLE